MVNHFGTQTGKERLTGAQQRLFDVVEELESATIAELVTATGLHENTVRGHLEKLHSDGLLRRRQLPAAGRGRPAQRWSVVAEANQPPYLGLALTLVGTLAQADVNSQKLVREAGIAWGAELAQGHSKAAEFREVVVEVMREQGFSPSAAGEAISLNSCPLLAAAKVNPEVVCSIHAGMVEGIARAHGTTVSVNLEPFATSHSCHLRLNPAQ